MLLSLGQRNLGFPGGTWGSLTRSSPAAMSVISSVSYSSTNSLMSLSLLKEVRELIGQIELTRLALFPKPPNAEPHPPVLKDVVPGKMMFPVASSQGHPSSYSSSVKEGGGENPPGWKWVRLPAQPCPLPVSPECGKLNPNGIIFHR